MRQYRQPRIRLLPGTLRRQNHDDAAMNDELLLQLRAASATIAELYRKREYGAMRHHGAWPTR